MLRDSELTLDWNLKWNDHPNKYKEHQKNETQLDNTYKKMIRYYDSINKVYKMSHMTKKN